VNLVNEKLSNANNSSVTSGELTGLAENQNTTITADYESRRSSNAQAGRSRTTVSQSHSRQLRDIVQDSTDRWLISSEETDLEYYLELLEKGYQAEKAEEIILERTREYHKMLRLGCIRYPQFVPKLIANLNNIRIASVSAGYAHVLLLSDEGQLYASGYNDRGQLGLG
jgi:hypothetical protein